MGRFAFRQCDRPCSASNAPQVAQGRSTQSCRPFTRRGVRKNATAELPRPRQAQPLPKNHAKPYNDFEDTPDAVHDGRGRGAGHQGWWRVDDGRPCGPRCARGRTRWQTSPPCTTLRAHRHLGLGCGRCTQRRYWAFWRSWRRIPAFKLVPSSLPPPSLPFLPPFLPSLPLSLPPFPPPFPPPSPPPSFLCLKCLDTKSIKLNQLLSLTTSWRQGIAPTCSEHEIV